MAMQPVKHIFFLAIGESQKPRLSKKWPSLGENEVVVKCILELPRELFRRPVIEAKIRIDEAEVPQIVLDAETEEHIAYKLSQSFGTPVTLNVTIPGSEE